ncbi:MAG: ParA family protein [Magnetococcales bacterium]|nr:ParA family protein [Magnetococcales bacterium]MBF0113410.1 ParA family protein [Magnetococcales bacterium]
MDRQSILVTIQENLRRAGITEADIRLQADRYKSDEWRVAIITEQFSGLSQPLRQEKSLGELIHQLEFQWVDLLTPDEVAWAGALPGHAEPEQLPLWSEVLARGASHQPVNMRFPTDNDEDLQPPIMVTFYSLRGGVGRSTALAYTAKLLSAAGHRVVCVDMDLEAPGLSTLFGINEEKYRWREDGQGLRGVVSLLVELDAGGAPDFTQHLVPVDKSNKLFLIPAGVPDAEYARSLRQVTPEFWYREEKNPFEQFFASLRSGLPFIPDAILVDARTGFSEVSGPLLFGIADMAIITFFPHPQAERGTRLLSQGILRCAVRRAGREEGYGPMPRFLVSPVPQSNAPEVRMHYRDRALEWVASWMEEVQIARGQEQGLEEIRAEEITHFVHYREEIASSDAIMDTEKVRSPYRTLADWIEGVLPQSRGALAEQGLPVEKKETIIDGLRIADGTAESQAFLLHHYVKIAAVERALDSKANVVLGRKGTGKTALFRYMREHEEFKERVIVLHAPQGMSHKPAWMMTYDGFKEVEKIIKQQGAEWRHFWGYYGYTALCHFLTAVGRAPENILSEKCPWQDQSAFLDAFTQFLGLPRYGIRLVDGLKYLDSLFHKNDGVPYILVMDGLDTGFGSTMEALQRRKEAVEGLFSFFMEVYPLFANLQFKIFLREDIWQKVVFQNKSHLFGRLEMLKWQDQVEFMKVLIRQVIDCETFQQFLNQPALLARLTVTPSEQWHEKDIQEVWHLLVGVRMKGGNAAFTRNWVWSRLADANGDHTPRFLLQLFRHALDWERGENRRISYEKSIIRPRALIESLPKVSSDAIASLKEEFGELGSFLDMLKTAGYTPVQKENLTEHESLIELATEIGLLASYEEDVKGNIKRYRVPDVYRIGLGMTRKGQA